MRWLVLLVLFVLIVGYLFLGGALFRLLESDNEKTTQTATRQRIDTFLAVKNCVTRADLETFVTDIVQAYDQGVFVLDTSNKNDNWDLFSSVAFSVSVITTVGYGHVTPSTFEGRLFCIIYSIVGIPFCVLFLVGIGEKLYQPVKKVITKASRGCGRVTAACVTYLIVAILLVVLPALGFYSLEGWTLFESIYYCVVTLTTVGFGDFVPGTVGSDNMILRRLLMILWIFIGLSWVASMFVAVHDMLASKTSKVATEDPYDGMDRDEKSKELDESQPSFTAAAAAMADRGDGEEVGDIDSRHSDSVISGGSDRSFASDKLSVRDSQRSLSRGSQRSLSRNSRGSLSRGSSDVSIKRESTQSFRHPPFL